MISFSVWHSLPLASRVKICNTFGVSKIGPTHVVNDRIESDGYRFQDIEAALTISSLQAFTNSKEKDFNMLWNLMAEKLEGREPAELIVHNDPDKVEIEENTETGEVKANGVTVKSPKKTPKKKTK